MRLKLTGLILLLAGICFAPIFPVPLPADMWKAEDFPGVKMQIQDVSPHLKDLARQSRAKGGGTSYNLLAHYGSVNMRQSLIGNVKMGTSHRAAWSFGVGLHPAAPHLIYNHGEETAQVTPETLADFLKWARMVQLDPETGGYREVAAP